MTGVTRHRRNLDVVCRQMDPVIPFYLGIEVDMNAAKKVRDRSVQSNQRITYTAMVLKAIAQSIDEVKEKYPIFNSHHLRFPLHRIVPVDEIRGTVMVAREVDGEDYAFPVSVGNPEQLSLEALSELLTAAVTNPVESIPDARDSLRLARFPGWIQRLSFFVLANSVKLRHRYLGTFCLTTVGKFGPDLQIPPTMGLTFAFGSIKDRVIVVEGVPAVRPTMMLTVSLDRRIFNGAPGAELLVEIKRKLESPEILIPS